MAFVLLCFWTPILYLCRSTCAFFLEFSKATGPFGGPRRDGHGDGGLAVYLRRITERTCQLHLFARPPTLHPRSLQRVRWACYGNVCSIASMLVSGHRSATYAGNFMYGLWGLHPQPKWQRVSTCVDSTAAHRVARWEECGPPSWTASRSGRTSRPGWP